MKRECIPKGHNGLDSVTVSPFANKYYFTPDLTNRQNRNRQIQNPKTNLIMRQAGLSTQMQKQGIQINFNRNQKLVMHI